MIGFDVAVNELAQFKFRGVLENLLSGAVFFARASFLRFSRRWIAPALRVVYVATFVSFSPGVFRWPVISVFSRPLAGPRSVVFCVSLGLCPVVYAAGAVRPGFVGRAASRRCLFFLMCFACSWSLRMQSFGLTFFFRVFSGCFLEFRIHKCVFVCVCVCVCVCVFVCVCVCVCVCVSVLVCVCVCVLVC